MDQPTVSVILPVYNAEDTIAHAITSILNQSLINFELLVILNGCRDETQSIVESFSDSRLKLIVINESHLAKALNLGITKSTGKYIARMDADDYSYPNRLETQVNFMENNPTVGFVSGKVEFDGDIVQNPGYSNYVEWANSIDRYEKIFLSRFQESALPHPSVLFSRKLVDSFGGYCEGELPEDFELWNRWLLEGVRMEKVPEVILKWKDSPSRLSRVSKNYTEGKFSKVKAEYFAKWYRKKFNVSLPLIYVWGGGSSVKRKTKPLLDQGLTIFKFIEVVKTQSPSSVYYKDLDFSNHGFYLSYVSDSKGKQKIKEYMIASGLMEGENFYLME